MVRYFGAGWCASRGFAYAMAVVVSILISSCRAEPLPVLWTSPAFTLVDQQGRAFGAPDLAGRAAILSFVYTSCTDTCPLLTATVAQSQQKLRSEGLLGSRVQLVSITVDPDRDTPAVLAEYGRRFHADPEAWRFLSGEREAIFEVLEGFKLTTRASARAAAGQEIIAHSNRFVVLDPRGRVRALLPGEETSAEELVQSVKRALES